MIQLTETAVNKVLEILASQEPRPAGLRIAVVGGGSSGFSYSMAFESQPNMLDKTYTFSGRNPVNSNRHAPGSSGSEQDSELVKNTQNVVDDTYAYEALKVFVDQASMLYLDGAEIDYVETLEGSGFKFTNPHVKSTPDWGSSVSA